MKIALIGPGMMEVPPKGWGAVESIIWKYYEGLKGRGHDVHIFNSPHLAEVARQINSGDFDFIHLQYDEYVGYFTKHLKKPFCVTSHYGYLKERSKWSVGYYSIFKDFLRAPGIIALSPEIAQLYKQEGYSGSLYILRNGVDVKEFAYKETGNSKVICLGKIEPRKRQAFLAKELDGKIAIDFIGPQVDEKFVTGVTTKQIGSWTREQVRTELTHYSSLILLSDGEAAPMVAIEALASGVSLVISQTASANINPTLPFVKIVPNNIEGTMLVKILKESIAQNAFHREAIRQYAEKFFDFPVILEEYLTIIENFASQTKRVFPKPYTDVRYFYSKAWRFMAKLYRQFR